MKTFAYEAPVTIDQTITLMSQTSGQTLLLAGGTDLLVQLRASNKDVDLVIDVKGIPELNQVIYDEFSGLVIGAAAPCSQIYESSPILENFPAIIDAATIIGGKAIQNRASFGGNLCNASPSGDAIGAMMSLGAICNVVGVEGARNIPIEEFCIAPGKNVLAEGEMLISIQIPCPKPNSGSNYQRFTPRAEMDIAVAGVGASIELNSDLDRILSARIALIAVAPTPVLATEASESLIGQKPSRSIFENAASVAKETISPITDVRGSAAQRKHLIGVLTRRCLDIAVNRAGYVS
ncbi:MAG: FAD binding domain-containing protein [Anaerolineales bacterium]